MSNCDLLLPAPRPPNTHHTLGRLLRPDGWRLKSVVALSEDAKCAYIWGWGGHCAYNHTCAHTRLTHITSPITQVPPGHVRRWPRTAGLVRPLVTGASPLTAGLPLGYPTLAGLLVPQPPAPQKHVSGRSPTSTPTHCCLLPAAPLRASSTRSRPRPVSSVTPGPCSFLPVIPTTLVTTATRPALLYRIASAPSVRVFYLSVCLFVDVLSLHLSFFFSLSLSLPSGR